MDDLRVSPAYRIKEPQELFLTSPQAQAMDSNKGDPVNPHISTAIAAVRPRAVLDILLHPSAASTVMAEAKRF